MIKSMTGFGRAELTFDEQYEVKIQIKSVNHRYADYSIKTPRLYSFLEETIRSMLSETISRGKVEVFVSINEINDDSREVKLNKPLAESYIKNLRELSEYNLSDDISISTLSVFPDIFDIEYKDIDEDAITKMLSDTLKLALDDFLKMRISEGKRLKNSILSHITLLYEQVDLVEQRSPLTVIEYKERLEKRMRDTLASLDTSFDDTRILTEVALFSDKVAVDEETVRLRSHINEFKRTMESSGSIGKKLDFIIQEMNRETNTIGSKCNDIELSKIVVEMKSLIEKIREQIQNIE